MRTGYLRKLARTAAFSTVIAAGALGITGLARMAAAVLHEPLGVSRLSMAASLAMSLGMVAVLVLEHGGWTRRLSFWGWGGALGLLLAVSALAFGPDAGCWGAGWVLSATVLGAVLGLVAACLRLSWAWRGVAGAVMVVLVLMVSPQLMCRAPDAVATAAADAG